MSYKMAQYRKSLWVIFLFLFYNKCFGLRLRNACRGRSASQGPTTEGDRYASLAIDGYTDQATNYAAVQDRANTGTAWWSVDLGYRRTILNLTVLWADNTDDNDRTIKRRYGYEINTSNNHDQTAKGTLCYRDKSVSRPTPAEISVSTCTIPSRFIHIYNTRPTNIIDASTWPNLEITEVIAMIKDGNSNCQQGEFGWDCGLTCHCASGDICDDNGDCPYECEELWGGPTCQIKLENVAEGKPANQGPTTKSGNEARFAVDGVTNQLTNYSHAKNKDLNDNVWWEVDLGSVQKIHSITVYFAEIDAYERKLRGFSLRVSNTSGHAADGDLCYHDKSGIGDTPPTTITLNNCSSGSYVRLYNGRNSTLDLNVYSIYQQLLITEVQVLADTGCAPGTYGAQCENACGHCKDRKCSREDGTCGDCLAGWFGAKCEQQCSPNCSSNECVKDSGYCLGGCDPGYYGDQCNNSCSKDCDQGCEQKGGRCNVCPGHKYGKFCENTCSMDCNSSNCPSRICHRENGYCSCGCAENDRFGDKCEKTCSDGCNTGNCSGRICHEKDGHCLCGCEDRKFGDKCDQKCPTRCIKCDSITSCFTCEKQYWGVNCGKACAIDCLNKECEKDSGKCHECSGHKYGDMCHTECPSNCLGGLCYQNGTCQKGCKDQSLYGDKCDIPCGDTISSCQKCHQRITGDLECLSCTDGRYGSSCKFQCPENCVTCKNDSFCTHCEAGYTGVTCDTVCSVQNCLECNIDGTCSECFPGRYGHSCLKECSDCETCSLVNAITGSYTCLTCKKGKYLYKRNGKNFCVDCDTNCATCVSGRNCTSCKDGFYDLTCKSECPETCQTCSSETDCSTCKDGWTGSMCQCNIKHCISDSDQSRWCAANGTCLKGCLKGFYGEKCEFKCFNNCMSCQQHGGRCNECTAGRFGLTCVDKCSANCAEKDLIGTSICNFHNGSCNFCENGWHGEKCDIQCNPNCLSAGGVYQCHQNTGQCERCKGNKYGPSCELDCASNCRGRFEINSCNKNNGSCVSCVDGYYDQYCNATCPANCKTSCEQGSGSCDECKSGFFGKFCEEPCPSNCGRGQHSKMIVCNRFSGECLFCKEGFYGEICNFMCNKFCALGEHKPACKKAGGRCLACLPGRHGQFCEDKCHENCGIADGRNDGVRLCDRNTSLCLNGCAKGWYNETCLGRCHSKCRGENCDFSDGKCSDGCVSGYEGDFCSLIVPPEETQTAGVIGGIIAALVVVVAAIIIFILVRRRYFGRPVRKGHNTRVHKRVSKNGITSDEIIPLYANVNGANSLPLPARNPIKASAEEELLADGDDAVPQMGCDHQASDYYNLSSLIPVAGFADYVHGRQAANVDWYKEDFAKLPRGLLKNCLAAVSPANRGKCRYKNLYPYDDSRVILKPDGNEKTDFINASYIHGYQEKEAFIAAQGPTEANVNDFWRMIWQKDCGKIVMLTNLYEEGKIKCLKYWPDEQEKDQYGNLEIEIVTEEVFSDYTLRQLKVCHKHTREEKDFKHFHFTAWPDRGVPENAGNMLHFRDKVNEADGVPNGPMLVHCSAGIGRTGTFIVTDYLIRQAKAESHLDVFRTVLDMRYQRANFVQTDIQYEFVHKALVEALTTKEMQITAADFCRYYWSLLEDKSEYSNQTKLQEQYETLNEMSASLDESCFTSGRLPENIAKNRYSDIVPVDTYRAYLSTPVKGSNEYINAVFLPTCLNKSAFLLTQMPLPHTVTDFWRLVYDQHVSTFVMMNNISDDDDETVGEYWPSEDCTYGPFKIELLSCENNDHYSIMAMKLTYISSSRQDSMTVRQFRFESWPDGDLLPMSTKALVSLIEAVNQSPKVYKDESVIVHCMNGNDRSGLFCIVAAIMAQLRTQQQVNIPQTILQLRRRRPLLLPNLEQYDFCHRTVAEHLDDTQIYSNVM